MLFLPGSGGQAANGLRERERPGDTTLEKQLRQLSRRPASLLLGSFYVSYTTSRPVGQLRASHAQSIPSDAMMLPEFCEP